MALFKYSIVLTLVALLLSACGGGGSGGGGNPPPPLPPAPPPANTTVFSVSLNITEVLGGSTETGSATASFTLDLDDNSLSGSVTLTGVTASGVSLRQGFAGEPGDEVLALNQANTSNWSIPDNTTLTTAQRGNLNSGQLFVQVNTSAQPNGALRGQIIPDDIDLIITELSEAQSIPPTGSSATALAFVTLNTSNGALAARVNTSNFPDATIAHIHRAFAGSSGGILINLTQDANNPSHWSNAGNEESLDAAGISALNAGELYFNFHSMDFAGGEIRGQIVPNDIDVVFTELSGDAVVMAGMTGVTTDASAIAASTINLNTNVATFNLNTQNLDDATAVTLNQAPAGQNGPVAIDFQQSLNPMSLWSAQAVPLNAVQVAALNGQGLYFTVVSPAFPAGEVRGQLLPLNSMMGSDTSFQVTGVSPANAAEVNGLPANATITFNRDVLAASLAADTIRLTASGGDGSFGEANDVPVSGISSSVNANTVVVELGGVGSVNNDIYQLAIADNQLTDTDGIILDGDNDGNLGGSFASTFNVVGPPPNPNATFTAIQQNVFSAICTECHSGPSPSGGLSLAAGQAYNNIVGVASGGRPALQLIEPGNPDNSYLIRKLEGEPDIAGSRMPLGQNPLPQSTINNIREWVSNGALNN
jgi:hypothetical protein